MNKRGPFCAEHWLQHLPLRAASSVDQLHIDFALDETRECPLAKYNELLRYLTTFTVAPISSEDIRVSEPGSAYLFDVQHRKIDVKGDAAKAVHAWTFACTDWTNGAASTKRWETTPVNVKAVDGLVRALMCNQIGERYIVETESFHRGVFLVPFEVIDAVVAACIVAGPRQQWWSIAPKAITLRLPRKIENYLRYAKPGDQLEFDNQSD